MGEEDLGNGVEREAGEFVMAVDLLKPGQNPTMTIKEAAAVRLLVRGVKVKVGGDPEKVDFVGVNSETVDLLHTIVTYANNDGEMVRLPFEAVVRKLQPESEHSLDSINFDAIEPMRMTRAVFKGDVDGVVERVNNGTANCFELAMVLQLIAKAYYQMRWPAYRCLAILERRICLVRQGVWEGAIFICMPEVRMVLIV